MIRNPWHLAVCLLPGLLLATGCGQKAAQADPEQARSALTRALDTWQNGGSMEDLKKSRPSVTVVEPLWEKGAKLTKYEVSPTDKTNGFDQQFVVTLWIQPATGKSYQEKAIYMVSTTPALVIVRSEPG